MTPARKRALAKLGAMSDRQLEALPTNTLDRVAFGFTTGDKITVPIDSVTIVHKSDFENALHELRHSPTRWDPHIDKPVEFSFRGGKLRLEDGHHRYLLRRARGKKTITGVVEHIEDNPILAIRALTRTTGLARGTKRPRRRGRTSGNAGQPLWYHLTDRAKFRLDPKFAPADNAIAIEDRSGRAGIYLAPDVQRWVNGHGYWRPFVAEFEADPTVSKDPGVHGRYGGEMFVPTSSFHKLKLLRVIPIDAYAREQYGEPGWIEHELGAEFDTGRPIPRVGSPGWNEAWKKYRNYRYSGPDVRQMSAADVARLKAQLRRVKG